MLPERNVVLSPLIVTTFVQLCYATWWDPMPQCFRNFALCDPYGDPCCDGFTCRRVTKVPKDPRELYCPPGCAPIRHPPKWNGNFLKSHPSLERKYLPKENILTRSIVRNNVIITKGNMYSPSWDKMLLGVIGPKHQGCRRRRTWCHPKSPRTTINPETSFTQPTVPPPWDIYTTTPNIGEGGDDNRTKSNPWITSTATTDIWDQTDGNIDHDKRTKIPGDPDRTTYSTESPWVTDKTTDYPDDTWPTDKPTSYPPYPRPTGKTTSTDPWDTDKETSYPPYPRPTDKPTSYPWPTNKPKSYPWPTDKPTSYPWPTDKQTSYPWPTDKPTSYPWPTDKPTSYPPYPSPTDKVHPDDWRTVVTDPWDTTPFPGEASTNPDGSPPGFTTSPSIQPGPSPTEYPEPPPIDEYCEFRCVPLKFKNRYIKNNL